MKHQTKSKKLLGVIMSLMMIMGAFPLFTFAANNGTITASGIEKGATVTAYKIVQQNNDGDWEAVKSGSISNPARPTAEEITTLAGNLDGLTAIAMQEGSDVTISNGVEVVDYTKANLEPGMYLVLVEKTNSSFVYNPMIISVNYDGAELEGGTVDADSRFQTGEDTAYAKRSKPTLDKEITGKTENGNVTGDETNSGDTLAVGDEITFKISTTIPAYSAAYDNDNLKFEISDTVSEGLDAPTDIVVTGNGTQLTEGNEYTLDKSGNTFVIKFKKNYLLSDLAKEITVTYKSKLNKNATSGFDANTNTAKVEYSNSPSKTDNKEENTYQYTFDIDGNVFGNKTGKEIVKVGVDETTGELITKEDSSTETNPLAGAKFGLYKTSDDSLVQDVTTDGDGLMKFTGLDAGDYYLKELQAPAGYKTDSTKVPVKIEAVLNADGTLASYTITINGQNTTTYTGNYDGETVTTVDQTGDTSLFNNYKAGVLPSTGGNGIYFYIIAGLALIGLAILVYVMNRRKEARNSQ